MFQCPQNTRNILLSDVVIRFRAVQSLLNPISDRAASEPEPMRSLPAAVFQGHSIDTIKKHDYHSGFLRHNLQRALRYAPNSPQSRR